MWKLFIAVLAFLAPFSTVRAQDSAAPCAGTDRGCLLKTLETATDSISESKWRDQTYRELAKLLTHERQTDAAVALIGKIQDPDTKAMTIRGIGMAAASAKLGEPANETLFAQLAAEADKIGHPPSKAIAYTYIAMAQAFAGDDAGAMRTAQGMENSALRNKAHNEAAKIQADRGDFDSALASIAAIDDPPFRDKAHFTISKIFADGQRYTQALASAQKITNAYQRSQAILYMLAKQITPDEVSVGPVGGQ